MQNDCYYAMALNPSFVVPLKVFFILSHFFHVEQIVYLKKYEKKLFEGQPHSKTPKQFFCDCVLWANT